MKKRREKNKVALITGVTGQDGSYLAEFLLKKEYEVWGLVRRTSTPNDRNIRHIDGLNIVEGDITDAYSVSNIVKYLQPDEIYNLAAQSHVATSFKQPHYTFDVNTNGFLNIINSVLDNNLWTKIYQASTSEMFGSNCNANHQQDEQTPFSPNSPYAAAKLASHNLASIYRNGYDLFISCGILFNHESERRGKNFVTQKIIQYVINNPSKDNKLQLGNKYSKRDWGYAPEYVEAMWLMLQQDEPDDYVIATGRTYSVDDFCRMTFEKVGITNYRDYIVYSELCDRPMDVPLLRGNAQKAYQKLGWQSKVGINELIDKMMGKEDLFTTIINWKEKTGK